MHIWVDADACPAPVKEVLFRAAKRCEVPVTLVANQSIAVPREELIQCIVVAHGADVADHHIVEQMAPGDLVITADIPLADRVVRAGGRALDPRGELLTQANIGARLAMRDLMDGLRGTGLETGGPRAFSSRDVQAFANQLDRLLAQRNSRK